MFPEFKKVKKSVKYERKDTLTQFVLLMQSVEIVSDNMGIPRYELLFTKAWVMSELFITRYYATKLLEACVQLGLFHKQSNRYRLDVECELFQMIASSGNSKVNRR